MKLRFLFVRAAAGTLVIGSAAPVSLPYEMQAIQNAAVTDSVSLTHVDATATITPTQRGDVEIADADDLHGEARLLRIAKNGDLPCDSGGWATSPLFGPHAGLAAALGVTPSGSNSGSRDTALADALNDSPATGDAASSAFGSVFGNADQPKIGGLGGGLFAGSGGSGGTGTGTGDGGPVVIGGGTGTGTGTDTGTGSGGGTGTGGGIGTGIGGGTGGGPFTGGGTDPINGTTGGPGKGGGTGGGTGDTGGTGTTGGGSTGGTGTGTGGTTAGDTGHTGTTGGGTTPPLDTMLPTNPGTGDHATGGSDGNNNSTQPEIPAAVPEPSSWATMLVGFGVIGAMLRRRRKLGFA